MPTLVCRKQPSFALYVSEGECSSVTEPPGVHVAGTEQVLWKDGLRGGRGGPWDWRPQGWGTARPTARTASMALLRRWRAGNWWHCSAHLRMRQHSWPSPETSHELWDFPAIRTRGTGKTSIPHQLPQLEYFTTAPPTAQQRLGTDFTRRLPQTGHPRGLHQRL